MKLNEMVKRIFDILVSLIAILILIPVSILIAILIFLEDRGPVIFKQKRVGFNLKPFNLYKFRSMTVNKISKYGSFDAGNLSRVTKIGTVLRKTKLDELPQLINVLKGDMSIVGPRPEVKQYIDLFPEKWATVTKVKPGITDNASIEFRNEEKILLKSHNPLETYEKEILPRKLQLYQEYVKDHTFYGDLRIILRTIYVVFSK